MAMDAQHAQLSAAEVEDVYAAKVSAELKDADRIARAETLSWRGSPGARLAFVISRPSDADRAAGEPGRGDIGDALDKVAAALGVSGDGYFLIASRPSEMDTDPRASRLALALEAADPGAVIALDGDAAADLAAALGVGAMSPGQPIRVRGRVVGAAGDLGASLADAATKARVWGAMKAIAAEAGLKATGRPKSAP